MPQRETIGPIILQKWRGTDERTQPTNVQEGFFTLALGTYFGLGDNCERIPGKTLVKKFNFPILSLYQFGNIVFIQTLNSLLCCTVSELFAGSIAPETKENRITENNQLRITQDSNQRVTNDV